MYVDCITVRIATLDFNVLNIQCNYYSIQIQYLQNFLLVLEIILPLLNSNQPYFL
jgi:hypothetical protein